MRVVPGEQDTGEKHGTSLKARALVLCIQYDAASGECRAGSVPRVINPEGAEHCTPVTNPVEGLQLNGGQHRSSQCQPQGTDV